MEPLEKALEAHPEDLERWLALSRAYRAAGRGVAARAMVAEAVRRAAACPEAPQPEAAIWLLDRLEEARVDAPDTPIDTPFRQEGQPAWKSYVAPTRFRIPDDCRPALFMHPPAGATWRLEVPADEPRLLFGMALDPQARDWPGDGVTFQVSVGPEVLWSEHLPKGHAGWKWASVDLDAFAARTVDLTLQTLPGPAGDATGDWAGWAHPVVVADAP